VKEPPGLSSGVSFLRLDPNDVIGNDHILTIILRHYCRAAPGAFCGILTFASSGDNTENVDRAILFPVAIEHQHITNRDAPNASPSTKGLFLVEFREKAKALYLVINSISLTG